MLPDGIYVSYANYVSTLTTPSDSPQHLVLTYDDPNHSHAINKDEPFCGRVKRVYYSRKFYEKRFYKKRFYFSKCSDKDNTFY